jgi:hypothetical protein
MAQNLYNLEWLPDANDMGLYPAPPLRSEYPQQSRDASNEFWADRRECVN